MNSLYYYFVLFIFDIPRLIQLPIIIIIRSIFSVTLPAIEKSIFCSKTAGSVTFCDKCSELQYCSPIYFYRYCLISVYLYNNKRTTRANFDPSLRIIAIKYNNNNNNNILSYRTIVMPTMTMRYFHFCPKTILM